MFVPAHGFGFFFSFPFSDSVLFLHVFLLGPFAPQSPIEAFPRVTKRKTSELFWFFIAFSFFYFSFCLLVLVLLIVQVFDFECWTWFGICMVCFVLLFVCVLLIERLLGWAMWINVYATVKQWLLVDGGFLFYFPGFGCSASAGKKVGEVGFWIFWAVAFALLISGFNFYACMGGSSMLPNLVDGH